MLEFTDVSIDRDKDRLELFDKIAVRPNSIANEDEIANYVGPPSTPFFSR